MSRHRIAGIVAAAGIVVVCLAAGAVSSAVQATPTAGTIETIAGGGTLPPDGVAATDASLWFVLGLAMNQEGDVFISDPGNCAVEKISGGMITRVAGTGVCTNDPNSNDVGDGGPALAASLERPEGLAFDSAGNLYIADSFHCEVRKVDMQTGIITAFAGQGPWYCGGIPGDGGLATSATLMNPNGLAIDGQDNVYISESMECRVRKVSAGIISSVAGREGWCGYDGDGGPAADAVLQLPLGLAASGDELFIADDCRIRAVSAGTIDTIAGDGSCMVTPDGPALSTGIGGAYGLAVDAAGALLMVDSTNCLVRRLDNGTITTLAGAPMIVDGTVTPVCGHTGDGGPATSAQIGQPVGVAVNAGGDVYFADVSAAFPGPAYVRVVYGVAPPPAPTPTATIDPAIDTDGDGCTDAKELQLVPPTNPTDAWDFYSVPAPALFVSPNPTSTVRDGSVSAADAQSVFAYFKKTALTGSLEYEQDLNGNGVKDGLEYDRSFVGPGMSGPPDGTVSASDAQLAFAQFKFGYRC